MANEKFTKGPWHWQTEDGTVPFASVRDNQGGKIARCLSRCAKSANGYPRDYETVKANARVISLAPDLLAFAERVAAHFANTDAPLGNEARALIERAA